jgi:hypothetical protein
MPIEDFRVITDPLLETDYRIGLVRNADKSINILTFDENSDPKVGVPLLRELGKAAERKVVVRLGTSWGGKAALDPNGFAAMYMKLLSLCDSRRKEDDQPWVELCGWDAC